MAGPELSDLVMDGFGSGRGVGTTLLILLAKKVAPVNVLKWRTAPPTRTRFRGFENSFSGGVSTVECCQVLTTKRFWKNLSL